MDNFTLVEFKNVDLDQFFAFCKEAKTEVNQPASVNMWDDDWMNQPHTLPYKLLVEKVYSGDVGSFQVLLHNEKIVGCGGVYTSPFCASLAIGGTRTWITKEYRNLSLPREYLLPAQKQWAIEHKFGAIALTFNAYNKNIVTIFKRVRLGEKRTPKEPHHIFYNGTNEVPFPVRLQYTKQYVIYENLDPNWSYDWETVRWM